jgi:hypothetical protein
VRVAVTPEAPTLPARPSPWLGGLVGAAIGGAVFAGEYGLNESWLTAAAVVVGPVLGAWLARSVRIDEPLLGWLAVKMAGVAVLIGALLTPVLWEGGVSLDSLPTVAGLVLLGLVFLGVPMFGLTLLSAMLWIFIVRTAMYR